MQDGKFLTTHWSVVFQARDATHTMAEQALAELCERYWYPLYVFVRRQGYSPDDAADLIQGYFTRFLDKGYIRDVHQNAGKFRSFLLASLKHFVSNQRVRDAAVKRGGRTQPISLDSREAEQRYCLEPVDELTPEMVYERRWALTVIQRALETLRVRAESAERLEQFEAFRPLLTGEGPQQRYGEIADQLQMSVSAVKVAIHRLRRSYGEQLRCEIADTVVDPADIDSEIKHLLTVLRDSRGGGS